MTFRNVLLPVLRQGAKRPEILQGVALGLKKVGEFPSAGCEGGLRQTVALREYLVDEWTKAWRMHRAYRV